MTERFAADWLAQREPFDHAARSLVLARRLVERLPRRPRVTDIGAGTGSMFRFLAPLIGRGQDWTLIDTDEALLDEAFGVTAAWARRQGFAASAENDTLHLSTPKGMWRLRALNAPVPPVRDTDAVVCSALLDLVSASWLERLLASLTVPFLACLTVDGRDVWRPHHPADALVRAAFRGDMRRDKGFGPALGMSAPSLVIPAQAATHADGTWGARPGSRLRGNDEGRNGFAIASAPSDWHIPRGALRMQQALIDGTADAAARCASPRTVAEWRETRLRQAMRGRLAISIGHRDILFLPSGG